MAFSERQLVENPHFITVLGHLARALRGVYDENPRLGRALASHQKWLLSQAAFALHLEHRPDVPGSGLTVRRAMQFIGRQGMVSRNTVANFLEEMVRYRYIHYTDEPPARQRRLVATETCDTAMRRWFSANLAALDGLDGGKRCEINTAHPEIFLHAQPRAARACIAHDGWREPPANVAMFLWTEAGGLVMDELISRSSMSPAVDGKVLIGRIETRLMAEHFMMSRTHLQRLFKKAADRGCIGWEGKFNIREMWISQEFLHEYCSWQAIKFSIVDVAFHEVFEELYADYRTAALCPGKGKKP